MDHGMGLNAGQKSNREENFVQLDEKMEIIPYLDSLGLSLSVHYKARIAAIGDLEEKLVLFCIRPVMYIRHPTFIDILHGEGRP